MSKSVGITVFLNSQGIKGLSADILRAAIQTAKNTDEQPKKSSKKEKTEKPKKEKSRSKGVEATHLYMVKEHEDKKGSKIAFLCGPQEKLESAAKKIRSNDIKLPKTLASWLKAEYGHAYSFSTQRGKVYDEVLNFCKKNKIPVYENVDEIEDKEASGSEDESEEKPKKKGKSIEISEEDETKDEEDEDEKPKKKGKGKKEEESQDAEFEDEGEEGEDEAAEEGDEEVESEEEKPKKKKNNKKGK